MTGILLKKFGNTCQWNKVLLAVNRIMCNVLQQLAIASNNGVEIVDTNEDNIQEIASLIGDVDNQGVANIVLTLVYIVNSLKNYLKNIKWLLIDDNTFPRYLVKK